MFTLEERSMNKEHNRLVQSPHLDTPSAPTILNTQHQNREPTSNCGSSTGDRGGCHQRGERSGHSGGRNGGRRGGRSNDGGGFSHSSAVGGGFYAWPMSYPPQRGFFPQPPPSSQGPLFAGPTHPHQTA